MTHKKSARVVVSNWTRPYPSKADEIRDRADDDSGRNFGRIARTGLLDDFVNAAGDRLLSGISAKYWRRFLKMFTETATNTSVEHLLDMFSKELANAWEGPDGQLNELLEQFRQTARLVAAAAVAR